MLVCNILSVYFLVALIYSCGCLGLLKILPLPTTTGTVLAFLFKEVCYRVKKNKQGTLKCGVFS